MAYRVKKSIGPRVEYMRLDSSRWVRSSMPVEIADELLRRLEWRMDDMAGELVSANMRIPAAFLEEIGGL